VGFRFWGAGAVLVDLGEAAVHHDGPKVQVSVGGLKETVEKPRLPPAAEAPVDTVPVAELGGEVSPRSAGSHNPQHPLKRAAVVLAGTPWVGGLAGQQGFQ
jgi:hypothetical protein